MARGLGTEDGQATKAIENCAQEFVNAKEELDAVKKAKTAAEEKVVIVQRKFVEAMKTEGFKSIRLEKLGGFRTQVEVYPNKTDPEKLSAYIKKRKSLAFLWTTSINGSKLKSWVKELMEQGKPLPPGIDPYTETQIRRYK